VNNYDKEQIIEWLYETDYPYSVKVPSNGAYCCDVFILSYQVQEMFTIEERNIYVYYDVHRNRLHYDFVHEQNLDHYGYANFPAFRDFLWEEACWEYDYLMSAASDFEFDGNCPDFLKWAHGKYFPFLSDEEFEQDQME